VTLARAVLKPELIWLKLPAENLVSTASRSFVWSAGRRLETVPEYIVILDFET
jgi:hypothetical protein